MAVLPLRVGWRSAQGRAVTQLAEDVIWRIGGPDAGITGAVNKHLCLFHLIASMYIDCHLHYELKGHQTNSPNNGR
jgi:hypothetical protein